MSTVSEQDEAVTEEEEGSLPDAGAPDEAGASDEASAPDEAGASDEAAPAPAEGSAIEEGAAGDSLPPGTVPAGDVSRAHLKGLIEALVFVSDHPLSINDIAKAAGRADKKLVRALADELKIDYSRRGIQLEEVAGGLVFRTNAAYGPFIREAVARRPVRMTRAQLETLAIIAYRQPITRPEVDEVRGVDSGPVLKMLLERDLVKILGKKDEPGRPLLYGTTPAFLEFFGLRSLKDLPSLREFTELSDDSRRVYDREMAEQEASLDALAAAAAMAHERPTDPDVGNDRPTDPSDEPRMSRDTDPSPGLGDPALGEPDENS
jgi:segregation and condensation protein B